MHPDAPRLISLVKLINDEAFFRVADAAIQVRGAVGLIQDSPEEKLFRVARNLRIPAGTSEIQRNAIARRLLRGPSGMTTGAPVPPMHYPPDGGRTGRASLPTR